MITDNALCLDALAEGGKYAIAIVAGGCFWCMQGPFDAMVGVKRCLPGYTGGEEVNPDYRSVCSGKTGHVEAVLVVYDPELVKYEQLLDIFWRNIDPTQVNGQFADNGSQYKTAIFYVDNEQKYLAEASRAELAASGRFDKPIATEVLPYLSFYKAEDDHVDYYKKNPVNYKRYHQGSGRAAFIKSSWNG